MSTIGYARVSTVDQNLDAQVDALTSAGAIKIFDDHMSGSLASRPGLDAALAFTRSGDVLTVWRLDRLGRSTRNTLAFLAELSERGVGFRSLTEGLDSSGSMGKAMLTIIASFAELERDTIRERTVAGLIAARSRGRVGGRPRALSPAKVTFVRQLHTTGHGIQAIAAELSVSRATIYRALETRR